MLVAFSSRLARLAPLLREIAGIVLAALPMLLAVIACQTVRQAAPAADAVDGIIAALPGRGPAAPLLGPAVPGAAADAARRRNAAVPFFTGPLVPAAPFRFAGSAADFANARECLALAALAEAGPSDLGQRAVIQVVLNRVRHPAFARTVCGTVFEGAERRSGCQFTFTCDGALARRYSAAAWEAARRRAEAALAGQVLAAVGTATHYHTDWVYPAWSPALVKLAQVDTHLFFRWPGFWGSRGAARRGYRGGEPDFAALTGPAPAASETPAPPAPIAPLPADTPPVAAGTVVLRDPTGKANFLLLDAGQGAAAVLADARRLCRAGQTCRVYGWRDRGAVPAALPLTRTARAALQFSYARDPGGSEIALYNCDTFAALPREQCIPRAAN